MSPKLLISKNVFRIEAIVDMDNTQLVIVKDSNEDKRITKNSKPVNTARKAVKKKPTFVCVMCQQRFDSHSALKNHFRDHGSQKIDLRGRPIEQSTLLKHPSAAETIKTNTIYCEYCSTIFPNISKALQHKFRKHKDMGNSFCEFCGKLFPLKCLLEQHLEKSHSDKADQKVGDTRENSEKDDEKHFDDQKYACSICAAKFVTIKALNFHIHGAHKVSYEFLMSPIFVPPPSTKIKLNNAMEAHSAYYCHLCGTEYIVKHNLRKHIRDGHAVVDWNVVPEGIIRCKTCEALFYNKKAYEAHLIYHSPGDWYISSEEQRERIISKIDQDFDIRRVPPKEEELVNNAMNRKRRRSHNKPSTSKFNQISESSDDESISPPSTPSDSDDEEDSKNSRISAFEQNCMNTNRTLSNKTNSVRDGNASKVTQVLIADDGNRETCASKSSLL